MLEFFKKLFGAKTVEESPAPYKVETPAPVAETATAVKKAAKKPAVKKAATRKPRVLKS